MSASINDAAPPYADSSRRAGAATSASCGCDAACACGPRPGGEGSRATDDHALQGSPQPPPCGRRRVVHRRLIVRDRNQHVLVNHEAGSVFSTRAADAAPFTRAHTVPDGVVMASEDRLATDDDGTTRIESCTYLFQPSGQRPPVHDRHRGIGPRDGIPAREGNLPEGFGVGTVQVVVKLVDGVLPRPPSPRWNDARRREGLPTVTAAVERDFRAALPRLFERRIAGLTARIRALGGRVIDVRAAVKQVVVEIDARHLSVLARETMVARLIPSSPDARPQPDGFGDSLNAYVCTGSPGRSIAGVDAGLCAPTGSCGRVAGPCMFLDAAAEVVGILNYREAGFLGESALGNTGETSLVVGMADVGFNFQHPAWRDGSGVQRVLGVYSAPWSGSTGGTEGWHVASDTFDGIEYDNHAQRVASIIGADLTEGQDSNIPFSPFGASAGARRARTGFAPRALFRAYQTGSPESTRMFGVTGVEALDAAAGTSHDVWNTSLFWDLHATLTSCTTTNSARGKTVSADLHNALFRDNDVFVAKSAGNNYTGAFCNTPGLRISGPAASTMVAVGALNDATPPCNTQSVPTLWQFSGGDTLPDGRSWPHLVVQGGTCGSMAAYDLCQDYPCTPGTTAWIEPTRFGYNAIYDIFGATSGAAPKITGAALLFKEWYLDTFGSSGNEPGRIVANILNMTDRYTGGASTLQPVPRYGLGRFRLKDWDSSRLSTARAGLFLTTSVRLAGNQLIDLDLGSVDTGTISLRVRRLNVVVWWDEPNTGSHLVFDGFKAPELAADTKPLVYVFLQKYDPTAATYTTVDYAHNDNGVGGEQMVSLTFDNSDPRKPCMTGGGAYQLRVAAISVSVATEGGRGPRRDFYVSCVWESDADSSLVTCGSASPTLPSSVPPLAVLCAHRPSNADR